MAVPIATEPSASTAVLSFTSVELSEGQILEHNCLKQYLFCNIQEKQLSSYDLQVICRAHSSTYVTPTYS